MMRTMAGCSRRAAARASSIMHADNDDADVIWFYELYPDQEAFAAHSGSPGMKELGGKLAGLVGGRPELHIVTPVKAKGLPLPT